MSKLGVHLIRVKPGHKCIQQDSGYTTKVNEGLGFALDENAVTVADALKDS